MWLVAKIKKKEFKIFKQNLNQKLKTDLKFYQPKFLKIISKKNKIIQKEVPLISNYIFINHPEFSKIELVNFLSFTKGLDYFLKTSLFNQIQILDFIKSCKNYEDENGYIKPNFFKCLVNYKAKFLTGPFANKVFQVIEKKENFIKIMLNDLNIKLTDKAKYLYQPI